MIFLHAILDTSTVLHFALIIFILLLNTICYRLIVSSKIAESVNWSIGKLVNFYYFIIDLYKYFLYNSFCFGA